ncbi:hypothetical protein BpHYR1_022373 [Brachionus plicatilis]|uniref:Uncharacterized protein n=1 Tax=Brachionus plicatilis TaxID=10195 RepID=A0A3M7T3J5_BRAPC|nr:hypothetical protein BpHYR1_022373 [Brachionus plicatilis]
MIVLILKFDLKLQFANIIAHLKILSKKSKLKIEQKFYFALFKISLEITTESLFYLSNNLIMSPYYKSLKMMNNNDQHGKTLLNFLIKAF